MSTIAFSNAAALLAQARAHLHADRYRAGRDGVLALRAPSDDLAAQQEYVRLLNILVEPRRTLRVLHDADIERWPVPWLLECAMIASTFGDQPLARRFGDDALRRAPNDAAAHHVDGVLQVFAGNLSAASAAFERALALAAAHAPAHWALARIGSPDAQRAERVRRQLVHVAPGSEAEILLQFALHHELHKLERYDDAWSALARGCALKRRHLRYDHRATLSLFDDVIARWTREFCADAADAAGDSVPVFIVGMHRSGTTVLEGLLGGHPQIADLGENYDFTAQLRLAADHYCAGALDRVIVARAAEIDFAEIGRNYLAEVGARARGARMFTEKLPSNFLNMGSMAKALPQAKFLHLVRDARDLCYSNLRMLYSHVNGYSYEQRELADFYRGYQRLMAHWHAALPGRVLDVSYRELVRDTERVVRAVCDFLELPFEPAMLRVDAARRVTTASAAQVRGGIRPPGEPEWKAYELKLQPLFAALQDE